MKQSMLSTIDNPWNPFDNFNEWMAWDLAHGYNSSSLLARVAVVGPETSDSQQAQDIDDAIDEIVRENVTGMFVKVTRET